MAKNKHTGVPTNGMEYTKGYKKRQAKRRRAEEKEWRSKNGPVIVTRIDPGV